MYFVNDNVMYNQQKSRSLEMIYHNFPCFSKSRMGVNTRMYMNYTGLFEDFKVLFDLLLS